MRVGALALWIPIALAADYAEELALTPLPHNMLLSQFSFEMAQKVRADPDSTEYTSFPRSLGQILDQSKTHELHLRFGQGWWDAETFGAEPASGLVTGGIGVEMWAWVHGPTLDEAKANWHTLANSLSGYFCASLNFIDETQTSLPSESVYAPTGDTRDDVWLLRGALPGEPVCTENLTPFLKLLPCKSYAGIASLLDGHSLFDSQWQAMAIDVDHKGDEIQLRQTISNVLDVPRMLQRRKSPLPRPIPYEDLICDTSKAWSSEYNCLPREPAEVEWQLSGLFGSYIKGECPLSEGQGKIKIVAPDNWLSTLHSVNAESESDLSASGDHEFSINSADTLDFVLSTSNSSQIHQRNAPPVLVDRSFTGWGQQRGGLRTVFTNEGSEPIDITYFESLPWYMRVYLHTLSVDPVDKNGDILRNLDYVGAIDRGRPSQLELALTVPGNSQVTVEYKFDKSLLFIEEYPPDANHGFEVAPGLVVTSNGYTTRTTSLLLSLPVPDFSMPYNVIILTSTVMSLMFGNIFNTITKTVVPDHVGEKLTAQKPLGRLLGFLKPKKAKQD